MSTVLRPGLIARMWHWRDEPGRERAWIRTRDGRLPVVLDRRSHIVVLEVLRRPAPGLGSHRPFG